MSSIYKGYRLPREIYPLGVCCTANVLDVEQGSWSAAMMSETVAGSLVYHLSPMGLTSNWPALLATVDCGEWLERGLQSIGVPS